VRVVHTNEEPRDRRFALGCVLAATIFLALFIAIPWFLNYWFGG
jgi:hypothetical protein